MSGRCRCKSPLSYRGQEACQSQLPSLGEYDAYMQFVHREHLSKHCSTTRMHVREQCSLHASVCVCARSWGLCAARMHVRVVASAHLLCALDVCPIAHLGHITVATPRHLHPAHKGVSPWMRTCKSSGGEGRSAPRVDSPHRSSLLATVGAEHTTRSLLVGQSCQDRRRTLGRANRPSQSP